MNPAANPQLCDGVRILGDHRREGARYLFSFDGFVNYPARSVVEVSEGGVKLTTDLFGIQKLYYAMDGARLTISDRLRDFGDRPLDPALIPMQLHQGFLPYPFTILKGVFKALPGAETIFSRDGTLWKSERRLEALQRFLSGPEYDVRNFKQDFLKAVEKQKRLCHHDVAVSFSGGFDSMLLAGLFREHLTAVGHYAETEHEAETLRERVRGFLPDVPWTVFCAEEGFQEDAVRDYFGALDEPCCDPAGLAEYLTLRKLKMSGAAGDDFLVLNGQWADTEFAAERAAFKEYLLGRFFGFNQTGLSFQKKIEMGTWWGKILDYFKSTRTRFDDSYTQHEPLSPEHQDQVHRVYEFYRGGLKLSRANFYGLMDFLLYGTSNSIEKMKTTSRALKIRYLTPFFDPAVVNMAFRMDARHKVGYRSGKKILKRAFPEVRPGLYRSGPFMPRRFWRRVTGSMDLSDYYAYFFSEWLKTNGKHA